MNFRQSAIAILALMIFMVIGANAQGKKNERTQAAKPEASPQSASKQSETFSYTFSQPDFRTSKIIIKHSVDGIGTVTFERSDSTAVTDPLKVSEAALKRINSALSALDFLNSEENYQYEKDYSHLGTVVFSYQNGISRREVTVNYTENPNMRAILDEYRKIGQQAMWIFDITLARDNQPLEAPGLMDQLDSYLRRGEVSDASQLVPFLTELSQDERIPLIARNKALRISGKIEKGKR